MNGKSLSTLLVAFALPLSMLATVAIAQSGDGESDAASLGSTRETIAKWVETQRIISREKSEWETGKEILEQRIALVEDEIALLEEKTSKLRDSIAEVESSQRESLEDNTGLQRASRSLSSSIDDLEAKTLRLLGSLPHPIRERVEPLGQRIPKDPASTTLSLSQRYQNVLGILNEINKFNGEIVVTSEVRSLPDGTAAEVQALYLGLGQAYYVTPGGDQAGIGRPTPDGWEWIEADELAGEIGRVIAMLQNEEVPAYVPLPAEIR